MISHFPTFPWHFVIPKSKMCGIDQVMLLNFFLMCFCGVLQFHQDKNLVYQITHEVFLEGNTVEIYDRGSSFYLIILPKLVGLFPLPRALLYFQLKKFQCHISSAKKLFRPNGKSSTASIKRFGMVPLEPTVKVKEIGSAHSKLMRLLPQKANLRFRDAF